MPDYRDPKVTSTEGKSGGVGRWIGIAAAVIILLLLLGWLLGWFGGGDVETVEPVATEDPAAEETVAVEEEPATTEEPAEGEEIETIEVEGEAEVVE